MSTNPIQLGDSDAEMNTRTVAKRFKTDEEKLKIIMEIKANLENVKKNEADKGMKIKKEKKTKKMKMNKQSGIPSKLGHYVVDNLDTSRMVIKTSTGDTKVDKQSVNALLGLPLGAIDISALIEANECTKFFSKWRRRYGRRRISPREL
ncbi:hypothetical protein R6Q59_002951, partial [Mikania micrantha]